MNNGIGPHLPYARVSPMTRIRVERILSAPGVILVGIGDQVEASQKVARITAHGEIQVVDVARILGLENHDLSRVLVKNRSDRVAAGEVLAARRGFLPIWHKPCRSPVSGRVSAVGYGWVVIEAEPQEPINGSGEPVGDQGAVGTKTEDLMAFVAGRVTGIKDHHSVIIETVGTHIVGACGVGGEGTGVLQVPVEGPADILTADDIGLGFNNAILVGGAGVSPDALERAREMKIKGVIVGSIGASLDELLPDSPFPVVATEGYGNLPMSPAVFDTLKRLEGHEASISGQMGETWDSAQPTIIVPLIEQVEAESELLTDTRSAAPAQIGDRVRAVRHPFLGQVGEIVSLSAEPQPLASGLSLPGAQIAFVDSERMAGTTQFAPWLNLERIG
jgi:hypothetical protein